MTATRRILRWSPCLRNNCGASAARHRPMNPERSLRRLGSTSTTPTPECRSQPAIATGRPLPKRSVGCLRSGCGSGRPWDELGRWSTARCVSEFRWHRRAMSADCILPTSASSLRSTPPQVAAGHRGRPATYSSSRKGGGRDGTAILAAARPSPGGFKRPADCPRYQQSLLRAFSPPSPRTRARPIDDLGLLRLLTVDLGAALYRLEA